MDKWQILIFCFVWLFAVSGQIQYVPVLLRKQDLNCFGLSFIRSCVVALQICISVIDGQKAKGSNWADGVFGFLVWVGLWTDEAHSDQTAPARTPEQMRLRKSDACSHTSGLWTHGQWGRNMTPRITTTPKLGARGPEEIWARLISLPLFLLLRLSQFVPAAFIVAATSCLEQSNQLTWLVKARQLGPSSYPVGFCTANGRQE